MIREYLAKKIDDDMDKLFEENGWGEEKIEEWKNEHMRTNINNEDISVYR